MPRVLSRMQQVRTHDGIFLHSFHLHSIARFALFLFHVPDSKTTFWQNH